MDGQIGTGARELLRDRSPDAHTGARDEGDLSFEGSAHRPIVTSAVRRASLQRDSMGRLCP